jgi:AraC-like DNA-binding protein
MSMQSIRLARTAHVLAYIVVLRRIGAPVERELRRVRLPTLLDEIPDSYFPAAAALRFLDAIARTEGLEDLGLLVTERGTFGRLAPEIQASIRSAPTLFARLQRLGELVAMENTHPRLGLFERFPNTRVRFGVADTSIAVPTSLLTEFHPSADVLRRMDEGRMSGEIESAVTRPDFPLTLKLALRPYLGDGYPDVDLAAQIAGTSARTLQRRLTQVGLSYTTLVRETRVEAAAEILAYSGATVLDAAYAVGYADPSNFARAFRRVAGTRPRRRNH